VSGRRKRLILIRISLFLVLIVALAVLIVDKWFRWRCGPPGWSMVP
jgi:hypothetical protein